MYSPSSYFTKAIYSLWLLFVIVFLLPKPAYAYLDPGSGSALITSLIAIATAGLYSLKGFYYKLRGKKVTATTVKDHLPVIFSEGKAYWGTFEPIVKELIKNKTHFRYISLDVFDPALEIESEYMHSKLYTHSSAGFGKLAAMTAPLMLATTPNIGSEGYPFPRPKNVKNLVHVFHSMTDSSNYRLGSLDFYDSVIMMGKQQEPYLRHVEKQRGIKEKKLVALGLPYLDNLYEKLQEAQLPTLEPRDYKTILIAPSWGSKGCFNYFGTDFVQQLHAAGYYIIIRLHPHSLINEPQNVQNWKDSLAGLKNLRWDNEQYSTHAMHTADVLISDTSSVRFDFAFLHLKPVITLAIPSGDRVEFESCYHKTTWDVAIAPHLGAMVERENIESLCATVAEVCATFNTSTLSQIRDENIVNFGNSHTYIATYISQNTIIE